MVDKKDCVKEKKVKNWGTGGGMYKGVKASVKSLNYIIVILVAILVVVVIYLSSTSSYTATFEMNGGEAITMENYQYGDQVKEKTPIKTGYLFVGWYLDKDFTVPFRMNKDKVKGNLTLYAKWIPAKIRILFDVNGGTVNGQTTMEPFTISFREPYGALPVPMKSGETFVGWQYNDSIIQADTPVTMNGEHTLKAVFE